MILIANPSHDTDTAIDILFRSTTDRLASHCRSRAVPGSDLNWKRLHLRGRPWWRMLMRPLSPARTCPMGAFRTPEPQRDGAARPVPPHALLDSNATSFPNTDAVGGFEWKG